MPTTTYYIRKKCKTETGDGKGFHYFETTQTELDDTITCPNHPEAEAEDFVIVKVKESES